MEERVKLRYTGKIVFLYLLSLTLMLNTPLWIIVDIILGFLVLVFLFEAYHNKINIIFTKNWRYHFAFTSITVMSIFWTNYIDYYTIASIIHINISMFILINYLSKTGINNNIVYPFLIGGIVSTITMFIDYGNIFILSRDVRIGSRFLENPNTYALMLTIVIIILNLHRFLVGYRTSKFKKILFVSTEILLAYQIIFLTGSRKGLLGLAILYGSIILYWILKNLGRRTLKRLILLLIVATTSIPIIIALGLWVYRSGILDRILNIIMFLQGENVNEGSIYIRTNMIREGIELIKNKPFVGWGIAQYQYLSGYNVYSHNNYIEILVSTGIIGFLFYYGYVFSLIKDVVLNKFKVKNRIRFIIFILMIFVLFNDIALVSYYDRLFWIVLIFSEGLINYYSTN